jgi:hypothetical protein
LVFSSLLLVITQFPLKVLDIQLMPDMRHSRTRFCLPELITFPFLSYRPAGGVRSLSGAFRPFWVCFKRIDRLEGVWSPTVGAGLHKDGDLCLFWAAGLQFFRFLPSCPFPPCRNHPWFLLPLDGQDVHQGKKKVNPSLLDWNAINPG